MIVVISTLKYPLSSTRSYLKCSSLYRSVCFQEGRRVECQHASLATIREQWVDGLTELRPSRAGLWMPVSLHDSKLAPGYKATLTTRSTARGGYPEVWCWLTRFKISPASTRIRS